MDDKVVPESLKIHNYSVIIIHNHSRGKGLYFKIARLIALKIIAIANKV